MQKRFEGISVQCDWVRQPSFFTALKGTKKGENVARKSKYEEYVKPLLPQITEWARSGATVEEIATACGVAKSTFCDYQNKYSELSDALRTGRQQVILNIKASLYKKAIGYDYEEKRGVQKDGKTVSVEVYKRHCPPDTTAAAMMLRNLDEEWRDRDKVQTDFKEKEIEIKKAMAQANSFEDLKL